MFNNIHKGNAIRSLLKDSYLGPRCVLDVLVDGKDEHEGEEDPDAAKEVPDVVPDVNKGSPTHLIETQLTRGSGNLTTTINVWCQGARQHVSNNPTSAITNRQTDCY